MKNKKILTYILLSLCLIFLIGNIILDIIFIKETNISRFINYIILILFSLFLALYIFNIKNEKNTLLNVSLIFLMIYNIALLNTSLIKTNISPLTKLSPSFVNTSYFKSVPDFTDKNLVDAIKWANENNISLEESYEYSDLIEEQHIIYQDIKKGANLSKIKKIKIIISDGPNKDKEIILKDLTTYSSEDVLTYIEENYLNNVKIVFEESDAKEDTLIKQSKVGTVKRSDEITFTFSKGSNSQSDDVKIIDFTNMSKLRAIFYLEKYGLSYEFKTDFSDKIKTGNIIKQSIDKNKTINRNDEKLTLTISKGKKINVPDIKKMKLDDILTWALKNQLKLDIEEKFDDSTSKGSIISASVNKNDVVEQKTLIKITISKGKIKMKNFNDIDSFKKWAEENNLNYQLEYEASDDIENGKIIKFSHKDNEVIKNNDTITVTISTGKETTVPNFIGLTKSEIIKKCNSIGLKYHFQYSNSTKKKDSAIRQSLSSGSKVAENTSISITLSNGKKESTNSNKNNSSSNNNNSNSSSSGNTAPPTPTCTPQEISISRNLNNIFSQPEGYQSVYNQLTSYFKNLNVKINIIGDSSSGKAPGSFVSGIGPGSKVTTCCPNNCKTYTITIAK